MKIVVTLAVLDNLGILDKLARARFIQAADPDGSQGKRAEVAIDFDEAMRTGTIDKLLAYMAEKNRTTLP